MIDFMEIINQTEKNVQTLFHKNLDEADAQQLHIALSGAALESITPVWINAEKKRSLSKQAYYLSAEFLVGRMIYNNLYCMGILDHLSDEFKKRGVDLSIMEDIEDDAFGNGGLGRLAACFLDSAVTCNVPLTGYGLRYRYGLFKQKLINGRQVEEPDDWSKFGDPWSIRRDDESVLVPMKCGDVLAVPYDMPVIGYGAENIGTLRLWQCESLKEIDFDLFNQQNYSKAVSEKNKAEDITKFLYPNDSTRAGKLLRVKQQYVLVSASIQDILNKYCLRHGNDFSYFSKEIAAQLNDTHPVMAIPELIRLLMLKNVSFEDAFMISRSTFAYTNHTVMQEALEKWPVSLLKSVSPELVEIIKMINNRFISEMKESNLEVLKTRCITDNNLVHMAQLAVYATHATNGVAELHSRLLIEDLFSDWYKLYPERFQNKTNGITQRRWLGLCNPELCNLFSSRIGHKFETDLDQLKKLLPQIDESLCSSFMKVKLEKKKQLCAAIKKYEGIDIDPNMVFDVQVKRLHEYKRQFMNALSILAIYYRLKSGELKEFKPTVMIFGAKSAPGYTRAKAVIHFINLIADMVNNDKQTNSLLKVVYIQNYNCSWAQKIIPAADISEQISPAGTEASGTGNMKLMLNGAVTLGTFDGANIEIVHEAGRENNYIFGATVEHIKEISATYDPVKIYNRNPLFKRCLDTLIDGTFIDEDGMFKELHDAILKGASWHKPDHYYVAQDFSDYLETKVRAIMDTGNQMEFAKKCLINACSAGKFSSDRTIRQYAEEIWNV